MGGCWYFVPGAQIPAFLAEIHATGNVVVKDTPLAELAKKWWWLKAPKKAFVGWPFGVWNAHSEFVLEVPPKEDDHHDADHIGSTEEVRYLLDRGYRVRSVVGPYCCDTPQEAVKPLHEYWFRDQPNHTWREPEDM